MIPKVYDGRNRTFWLYGYEDSRRRSPRGTYRATLPTALQKTGDFSGLLALGPQYQIYDPATTTPAPGGRFQRQPFPGNVIPANRINLTARKLSEFWPAPNLPGARDGSLNYTDAGPERVDYGSHLFRVDHNFSDRHRIYFRGDVGKRSQQFDVRYGGAMGADFYRRHNGFAIDDVYTFSPTFFMNVRYGYTRFNEQTLPLQEEFDLAALGFSTSFIEAVRVGAPRSLKLPFINITGGAQFGQFAQYGVYDTHREVQSLAGSLTKVIRSHMLRYGAEYRIYRDNTYNLGQSSARLDFGTTWTNGPFDNSPGAPLGQELASFLLGLPSGGVIDSNDSFAGQSTEFGLYLHDDWKVSSRLTLSLGLRYELSGPLTERFNRTARGFDISNSNPVQGAASANYARNPIPEVPADQFRVTGGLTFAGVGGLPRSVLSRDANNIMPRFGFAYSVDQKTVVRGGYGLYFDQLGLTRVFPNQTGFNRSTLLVPSRDNGQSFIASLSDPFPAGFERANGSTAGLSTFLGRGFSSFNKDLVNPHMQRWQVGCAAGTASGHGVGSRLRWQPRYKAPRSKATQSGFAAVSEQIAHPRQCHDREPERRGIQPVLSFDTGFGTRRHPSTEKPTAATLSPVLGRILRRQPRLLLVSLNANPLREKIFGGIYLECFVDLVQVHGRH